MSTEKHCHFAHLLQVSKKYLWSLILYIIFHFLYMYIALGQGQTTPWVRIFMLTYTSCHSGHLLQVSFIKWLSSRLSHIKAKGTKFDLAIKYAKINQKSSFEQILMSPKPQCYTPRPKVTGPLVPEKKIFEGFLPYMGMAAILVMWPRCPEQTFVPPTHGGSTWNLALIGPAVLEKKIFENGGRTDANGQRNRRWSIPIL